MEIEIETVFKAITEPILSSKTVHFQSNYTKTAFRMISVSNLLCDYLNFFWFFVSPTMRGSFWMARDECNEKNRARSRVLLNKLN